MEKSFLLDSGRWIFAFWLFAWGAWNGYAQTPLPGAVGQQAVTDAAAQQEREKQRQSAVQPRPEEPGVVEANQVSGDLGSLQMLREKPDLPFFRLRAD